MRRRKVGHIEQRGPGRWKIKISLGKDKATGKYIQKWFSIRGSRKDAVNRLSELLKQYSISGIKIKTVKKSEYIFQERMEKRNCQLIHKGWPDFAIFNKDGTIEFVEVKSEGDKLSIEQYMILTLLNDAGLKVKISDGFVERDISQNELFLGRQLLGKWGRGFEYSFQRSLIR